MNKAEQEILPRLTVFRAGFTGEAATTVTGAPLRVLSSLVEKSLVQRTVAGRYLFHELLRQYGAEKLPNPVDLSRRHAQFFADFQHQREDATLHGQPQVIKELSHEIDNIRTAWEWSVEQQHTATLEKLLPGLTSFYELRGWFQDGVDLLSQVTKATECPAALLGRSLEDQARLYDHLGNYKQACDCARQSMALYKQLADRLRYASALSIWGFALSGLGNNTRAKQVVKESLHLFEMLDDLPGQAVAHYYLAFIATGLGERDSGLVYIEESLRLFRQLDHHRGMADTLFILANFHLGFGNYPQAQVYYNESKALHQTVGNRVGVADCLMNQGLVALYQ